MITHTSPLLFFSTPPDRCGYFPEREAVNVFVDPYARVTAAVYSRLIDRGFRRSGRHVYLPRCPACRACVPTRIPAARFRPNRSQRRNLERNRDITVHCLPPRFQRDHFALYCRYQRSRHPGGAMDNPTPDEYRDFLSCPWSETLFAEFRLESRLVAVAVTDVLPQGLSAVYTFYEPGFTPRGLGTLAILWQIEEARRRALDYVYLGYWIKHHPKMGYKARFRPIEGLIEGQWQFLA